MPRQTLTATISVSAWRGLRRGTKVPAKLAAHHLTFSSRLAGLTMPAKTPDAPHEPSFEEAFRQLENLVDALETGDIALSAMVEKYTEGHKLLRLCQKHLKEAELKIEQLKDAGDKAGFQPFEGEEAEG